MFSETIFNRKNLLCTTLYVQNCRCFSFLIVNSIIAKTVSYKSDYVYLYLRSKSAELNVREKLKFNPKPVDKKFEYGTSVRIHCTATGEIAPKIKWMQVSTVTLLSDFIL